MLQAARPIGRSSPSTSSIRTGPTGPDRLLPDQDLRLDAALDGRAGLDGVAARLGDLERADEGSAPAASGVERLARSAEAWALDLHRLAASGTPVRSLALTRNTE